MANDRAGIVKKYQSIIGRNYYSQPRRSYVFTKYSNGCYYSDCSSSVAACFKACGHPIKYGGNTLPNTVGMYHSTDLVDVPVKIKNGQITNPEILQTCDVLLYAGTDKSRSGAGYVGHVEMVGEISGSKVWLYGHGSSRPKRHEMTAYNKQRYNSKTSTKVGNKGLIKVRRHKDFAGITADPVVSTLGERILKNGMSGGDVVELQRALIELGYSCGSWGADGDYGDATEMAVRKFQAEHACEVDGEAGPETIGALKAAIQATIPDTPKHVQIMGGDCWVRAAPNKATGAKLGAVKEGTKLPYGGQQSADGWLLVEYNKANGWVSGLYGKLVE